MILICCGEDSLGEFGMVGITGMIAYRNDCSVVCPAIPDQFPQKIAETTQHLMRDFMAPCEREKIDIRPCMTEHFFQPPRSSEG